MFFSFCSETSRPKYCFRTYFHKFSDSQHVENGYIEKALAENKSFLNTKHHMAYQFRFMFSFGN